MQLKSFLTSRKWIFGLVLLVIVCAGVLAFSTSSSAGLEDTYLAQKQAEFQSAATKEDCNSKNAFTKFLASAAMGNGSCWFCPVFVNLFSAVDTLATKISLTLSNVFLAFLALGTLFWILFYVGRVFVSLQPIEMGKFISEFLRTMGRVIVATALLFSLLGIFVYLISPIVTLSMGLTAQIMDAGGFSKNMQESGIVTAKKELTGYSESTDKTSVVKFSICSNASYGTNLTSQGSFQVDKSSRCADKWGKGKNHAFDVETCEALECSVRNMSASLIGGMAIGSGIMAYGWEKSSFLDWQFSPLLIGLAIMLGHFVIFLAFPFKLLDAVVRLGFVCALAPLFIVLWVFPSTRDYTKKAWDMLLGSCMVFVFMAVVLVLLMSILTFALPANDSQSMTELLNYLTCGVNKAATVIQFSGKDFWMTVAVCFIGYKLLGMATDMAKTFGLPVPSVGADANALKTAVSVTKTTATKVVAPVAVKGGQVGMRGIGYAVAAYRGGDTKNGPTEMDDNMKSAFEAGITNNRTTFFSTSAGEQVNAVRNERGEVTRLKGVTDATDPYSGATGKKVFDAKGKYIGIEVAGIRAGESKLVASDGRIIEETKKVGNRFVTERFKKGSTKPSSQTTLEYDMTSGKFVKTNYDFDKETAWKQTGTGTLNIDGTISNFLAEAQTNSKLKYDGAGEAYMSNDPKDYESTVAYQHDSNGNYTGAITTKWKDGVPTAEKTLESYGATTKVAAKIDANGNAGEAESKNLIGEEVYSSASEEAWRDWQMGPMRAGNQVGNKWQAFKTGVWDWFRGHGKGGSLWD